MFAIPKYAETCNNFVNVGAKGKCTNFIDMEIRKRGKIISVSGQRKREIARVLNCSLESVYCALRFAVNSALAERIKEAALARGGRIEYKTRFINE